MKNEKEEKKNLPQIVPENVLQQSFIIIIIIIIVSLLCTRDNMFIQIFMSFLRGMIANKTFE